MINHQNKLILKRLSISLLENNYIAKKGKLFINLF